MAPYSSAATIRAAALRSNEQLICRHLNLPATLYTPGQPRRCCCARGKQRTFPFLNAAAGMGEEAIRIILFTTSCPSTHKVRGDIERILQLLHAKRIDYEEVHSRTLPVPTLPVQSFDVIPLIFDDQGRHTQSQRSMLVAARDSISGWRTKF